MSDGLLFDRKKDLAALDRIEGELGRVDDALARLDDGTHGTCRSCGAVLPDEKIAADPLADRCAAHGEPG